jgi:Hint domain-containing protein
MIRSALTTIMLLAVVAAGCTGTGPATSPSPTPGPSLTTAELRLKLIETFGPLWFCDPDFYPIQREDEAKLAVQRFGEVQADREAFAAILKLLAIPATADFTADQKLVIYRAWKQLNAITLEPAGNGTYRFDYLNMPVAGATEGRRTAGTIDDKGTIKIDQQAAANEPACPICLARGTRIATPDGDVAIEDIRIGMRVWSIDETGRRIVANVIRIGQTRVPASHHVVRLVLDDGRIVRASPGHPLADGRLLAAIKAGDRVDGATVVNATLEPYDGGSTFDLLTDSPTHAYVADGIPLGSTLAP